MGGTFLSAPGSVYSPGLDGWFRNFSLTEVLKPMALKHLRYAAFDPSLLLWKNSPTRRLLLHLIQKLNTKNMPWAPNRKQIGSIFYPFQSLISTVEAMIIWRHLIS